MRLQQQYDLLLELKEEINSKLKDLSYEKIKELILWLAKSNAFQKLKDKENELIILDFFCTTWMEEKKRLTDLGIEEDIFYGITSLDEVESKYLTVKFAALRMEVDMPIEFYEQAVDSIIEKKVTGVAICKIIVRETAEREKNILQIAGLLKIKGQYITALVLLQEGSEIYPENDEILLELADCWLEGQQWKQAYECLKKIKIPNTEVSKLVVELATMVE